MKSTESMFSRMREDEIVARTRYHADRLREAERLAAFHRTAMEAARAELDALGTTHQYFGPTARELATSLSWMRKTILLAIAGFATVCTMAGVASAQTGAPAPASTGSYPNVANLQPFSAGADFMSLPGYLRYLVYQQKSEWLTRSEADRIVRQERGL